MSYLLDPVEWNCKIRHSKPIKKIPITVTDYTLFPHITKPMIDIYDDVIL
jgi:hypothetical protein